MTFLGIDFSSTATPPTPVRITVDGSRLAGWRVGWAVLLVLLRRLWHTLDAGCMPRSLYKRRPVLPHPAPPSTYSIILCRHVRNQYPGTRLLPRERPAHVPSLRTTVLAQRHHSTRAAASHSSSIALDDEPQRRRIRSITLSHEEVSRPSAPPGHGLRVRREAARSSQYPTQQPAASTWPCSHRAQQCRTRRMLRSRAAGKDDD
jgi:hypothetical protein